MAYQPNNYQLIGQALAVNFNGSGDVGTILVTNATSYIPLILVTGGGSASMTTAVFNLRTGAGGTGTVLLNSGAYGAAIISPSVNVTNFSTFLNNTASTLYINLTTPQGSALTADVYVYGLVLTSASL